MRHVELKVNDRIIRGYLEQTAKPSDSIVVFLHGFTGHRVENGFLFRTFARKLRNENIASLRMDFSGSGDSDGEFNDFTFSSQVREAHAMIDFAKTIAPKIFLLGFSMGGAVAGEIAKTNPDTIAKLVLWAPAGNLPSIANRIRNNAPKTQNDGYDLGGFELSQAFCEEIITINPYENNSRFERPALIVHGENDQAVEAMYGEKYAQSYKQGTYHLVNGANHVFGSLAMRDQLYKITIDFIKK